MKIESYEIRNSLGVIGKLTLMASGDWADHQSNKLLNDAEKDGLIATYKSFGCHVTTVYGEPDLPEIHSDCVAIEFVAKDHYTGKEIIMYAAIRIDDYWLMGIKVPSARCEEKYIQQMILTHSKREIEVRYYDNKSKRIER